MTLAIWIVEGVATVALIIALVREIKEGRS